MPQTPSNVFYPSNHALPTMYTSLYKALSAKKGYTLCHFTTVLEKGMCEFQSQPTVSFDHSHEDFTLIEGILPHPPQNPLPGERG